MSDVFDSPALYESDEEAACGDLDRAPYIEPGQPTFFEETRRAIAANGQTPAEICFLGSAESGHECTWAEFRSLADFKYDATHFRRFTPDDLIIVFRNGDQMFRTIGLNYEHWTFCRGFRLPEKRKPIQSLFVDEGVAGEVRLAAINGN